MSNVYDMTDEERRSFCRSVQEETPMPKPVNTQYRKVPGGYVRRIYLGDRWGWKTANEQREPLPLTASTLKEAIAWLQEESR